MPPAPRMPPFIPPTIPPPAIEVGVRIMLIGDCLCEEVGGTPEGGGGIPPPPPGAPPGGPVPFVLV